MTEPSKDEMRLDQRLSAALHQVKVPLDLRNRIAARLQLAADEEHASPMAASELAPVFEGSSALLPSIAAMPSEPWYRRRFIQGIAVAAGMGGMAFIYRELTRPLSQSWLLDCSLVLREQVISPNFQLLPVTATLLSTPTLTGLQKQTRGLKWTRFSELRPPAHVKRVTAFEVGDNIWAFELTVPRRVEGLSEQLTTLSSHSIAAMALGDHVLFLAGSVDLTKYILPPQAI